uniref:DUF7588 domain-containing protein n=1 Tax=Cajanus cajan TaxID=3821 RepID=A0A151R3Z6_CAJCA|nr:hypothetical protein KK1_041602 [Cajanus cajan]
MKERSIPAAVLYRIQYKVMNSCNSRALLKTNDRETTLFVTDMTKANVAVPKLIKWDEIELPTSWQLEKATPTLPRQTPEFQEIRQSESGKVEIIFDRRNSFSSRTEATRSEYTSARRSFSVAYHNPVQLLFLENPMRRMTKSLSNLQLTLPLMIIMIQSEFHIDKEALRKDFYLEENQPQRSWFLKNYQGLKRAEIHEIYYNFLNNVRLNIPFLDWFTIKNNIDYPFKHDLIGKHSTNVITVWHLKDGEKIQSELRPKTQYQLPQIQDDKNNPVLAAPFKTKDVDENLTSKDIKSLMEQVNYTNKYLQVLGDKLATQKSDSSQPLSHLEKPIFQPFKLSQKAKQSLQKAKVKANMDSDASELLSKINNFLKATTIPDTPQGTEEASSRPKMRMPTRTIGVLNQGSDQDSDSNLAIEDRDLNNNSFNANNVYEWNIDGKSEYNFTREDSQQPFWTEKFLAGLPRSLGDKVRDKIRALTPDNIIPYDHLRLDQTHIQNKIKDLLLSIQNSICADIPHAFWNRKQHIVNLPYEKDLNETQIPTKARPIQMNEQLLHYCHKEIKDLLSKGLIRPSKSPWSCAKSKHPLQPPPFQRNSYVKWWPQFDASRANSQEVKNWFVSNTKYLKIADPETSLFLNQKAKITASLATAKTKESFAKNLEEILILLKKEGETSKSSLPSLSESTASLDEFYQNEDDCFGVNLTDI